MTKQAAQMWSKVELYQKMVKEGWQPGTVDGIFVHRNGTHIDMNERRDDMTLWMSYALIQKTPPPF